MTQQPSGFEGATWAGSSAPRAHVVRYDGAGRLRHASADSEDAVPVIAPDPAGGIAVAILTGGQRARALEAYDGEGALRWRVSLPDVLLVSHAIDRAGNTLVLFEGEEAFGKGQRAALWIDRAGRAGAPFQLQGVESGGLIDLAARIRDGFFVRKLGEPGSVWVGEIGAASTILQHPPPWLAARPGTAVHLAHRGTAYAVVPDPRFSIPCAQVVEVISASGRSCGSAEFSIAPTGCFTSTIVIGQDGTVIQQFPDAMEARIGSGSRSCTWRWWSGFFR
ncbi:MAG: hypothetical protein ACJ79H_06245 [Myxococcales bacterium]